MSNYTPIVNYAPKDALTTGDPAKKAKGVEVSGEFTAISTAITSKEDSANKNVANGYAGLDSSALLPDARLTSNVPLKNASNTFTGTAQTISSADVILAFIETDASANNGKWRWRATAEGFRGELYNDADSVQATWVQVDRTGTTIDSAVFTATTITLTGTVTTSGNIELGHATQNTLSGASGVLSIEGHAVATIDQAQTVTGLYNYTTQPTLNGLAIGYLEIPQNSKSAAYTTVLADNGKHIYHPSADTTARIWTIDSNANVPYPVGATLTFVNDTSAGVITISITADTLVLAGSGATGSRTLAASGIASAIKMTTTRWMISGTGLT